MSLILEKKPFGIPNSGNFCYIISALQALFNDKTINEFIFQDNIKIDKIINKLLNLFLDNTILNNEDAKIKLDKIKRLVVEDKELCVNICNDLNITLNDLQILIQKFTKDLQPIYMYIYFNNLIKKYKYCVNSKNKSISEKNNIIQEEFIVYIKQNNKLLNYMNISELVDGEQHDAQEYILTLLDILNDSRKLKINMNLESEIINMSEKDINKLDLITRINYGFKKAFYMYNKDGYTVLKKKLYFYTIQFIDCRICDFRSISFQENSMLSLPIPENINTNTIYTLYDCLDKYFNIEILEHEYKCDECNNKKTNNILRKKILSHPNSLIIFIKRFNFNVKTMNMCKNNTKIIYPLILNLEKYYMDSNKINTSSYKLKSVICHHGVMNYGHYISYVCKTIDNIDRWFKCNDENINFIPIDDINNEIINDKAYMLFYEKII